MGKLLESGQLVDQERGENNIEVNLRNVGCKLNGNNSGL
jgi:hypothetical protein